MRFHPVRLAVLLSPLLAAPACTTIDWPINWLGQSPQEDLNDRLAADLAPDIAAGRVSLRRLPDGAAVTFADQSLFAPGKADLNDAGRDALTSTIQALVDPNLLHIGVAEDATTSADLQAARVQTITNSFDSAGLVATARPPMAMPPMQTMPAHAPVQGVTITMRVVQG